MPESIIMTSFSPLSFFSKHRENPTQESLFPASRTLAAILLGACLCAPSAVVEVAPESFQDKPHQRQRIRVAPGETFSVVLVSNATTGFCWSKQAKIVPPGVVRQLDHLFIPPPDSKPLVAGAPGREKWAFEAVGTGKCVLVFEYGRPWEDGEKAVRTFELNVSVEPPPPGHKKPRPPVSGSAGAVKSNEGPDY
jgi:predicted secreted protein